MEISGTLVDIYNRDTYPASIKITRGKIESIVKKRDAENVYIIPGLIDAHIHIESSMVTPGEFAIEAVKNGTTGVISDPHEIANVLGIAGIEYMIKEAEKVPVRFWFGAPSCVPATRYETSGAMIDSKEIERLLRKNKIKYLAEMMNFPGVIYDDGEVRKKIEIAGKYGKPIDGHAPGLTGIKLIKYISAGISTDHECSSLKEAEEKIAHGMKILIREGSAARNLNALKELFKSSPEKLMLCSDDLHPEMLVKGHINKLIAELISQGYDLFDVIRSASFNPVNHYNLDAGLIKPGHSADLIIVDKPEKMNVLTTWIKGKKVFENGEVLFKPQKGKEINHFNCTELADEDIKVINGGKNVRIIEAFDGELLTKQIFRQTGSRKYLDADVADDILKIVVKDRYNDSPPATGFIKGFGLKNGAFGSSVAHDSHNIIAVGTNDSDIIDVINEIIRIKGGLAVSTGEKVLSLQLGIGGIMSVKSCREVAGEYENLSDHIRFLGSTMAAPFMTLSFMALLVIPELKIGDRGLFDVDKFQPVPLFEG